MIGISKNKFFYKAFLNLEEGELKYSISKKGKKL